MPSEALDRTGPLHQNWAETVTYAAPRVERPASLEELVRLIAGADKVKALGSRHSFNGAADTSGMQIELTRMPKIIEIDPDSRTVRCAAGLTHSDLSHALDEAGLALPNLASLPHISVAGAIQTGTHGSGVRNAAMSAGVESVELVDARGDLRTVRRGDPDFLAVVVGLGAFGVVHTVTQRCVPAFDLAQTVYQDLPWEQLLGSFDEVLRSGYSVSVFTRYDGPVVPQVWVKRHSEDPAGPDLTELGARVATETMHMLPLTAADNVTEQHGVPGRSFDRLPHFRHNFRPGRGDEIQSEYLVAIERGAEAIDALRRLSPRFASLLHMSEIRSVAADDAWLSPSGGRGSLALHFTWQRLPEQVDEAVALLEEVLVPLGGRPHWGKVFHCDHPTLLKLYPRLDDFTAEVDRWDPSGKFANSFLEDVFGRVG